MPFIYFTFFLVNYLFLKHLLLSGLFFTQNSIFFIDIYY
nr:MAG TPA: hypothetical protein [Caudoviricetes sp.]